MGDTKQIAGQMWPLGHSLWTPDLRGHTNLAPSCFSDLSHHFSPLALVQPLWSLPFSPRLFSQGLALSPFWIWAPPHKGLSCWSQLRERPLSSFPILVSCFILFLSSCHWLNASVYLFTSLVSVSLARMLTPWGQGIYLLLCLLSCPQSGTICGM